MKREPPLEDLLRDAETALEAANNANQALLETLSHDLRTPLNTIIGFADMMDQELLGPMDNPQYRSYAEDIVKSGRNMLEMLNDVLEMKRFENLEKSEKDFRHIIELAPDLIAVCREGCLVMINPAGANMLGMWPVDTLIGRRFDEFVHPDYIGMLDEGLEALVNEQLRVPVKLKRPDGVELDVEIAALPYQDEDAKHDDTAVMLMARDVSERNRAIRQVAAREEHLRKIMDTVIDGILTIDQSGLIETANPAADKIFDYSPGGLVGQNVTVLFDDEQAARYQTLIDSFLNGGDAIALGRRREIEALRRDGSRVPIELALSALRVGGRHVFIGAVRDITERIRNEAKLREMATSDPLTKMPNRALFNERLEGAVRAVDYSGGKIGIIFIDLDNFKNINDALGHVTGDRLIQAAGKRLGECVRAQDIVAHFGGDEFSIILDGINEDLEARGIAEKMRAALAAPFRVDGKEIYTSGSVGVVTYPGSATNISEILKNADTATHHAKRLGRNNCQVYSEKLSADVQRRMEIENGLRHALENDEFTLVYQAKVDLESREVTGAEALLRWESPALGFVSPEEFVPVAEETGLIVPIGGWVMRTACREAVSWQALSEREIQVGVNLSALQFVQGDLTGWTEESLQVSGLKPELLDLELTESMLVENPDETIDTLNELKGRGISISMDDFGTGYSSLSYLTRFPLDSLKVDRAFVMKLPDDKDAVAIASSIISMAQSLGLHIVAEGIETESQVGFLHSLGAHVGQGYFFSKPVASDKFAMLVRQGISAF